MRSAHEIFDDIERVLDNRTHFPAKPFPAPVLVDFSGDGELFSAHFGGRHAIFENFRFHFKSYTGEWKNDSVMFCDKDPLQVGLFLLFSGRVCGYGAPQVLILPNQFPDAFAQELDLEQLAALYGELRESAFVFDCPQEEADKHVLPLGGFSLCSLSDEYKLEDLVMPEQEQDWALSNKANAMLDKEMQEFFEFDWRSISLKPHQFVLWALSIIDAIYETIDGTSFDFCERLYGICCDYRFEERPYCFVMSDESCYDEEHRQMSRALSRVRNMTRLLKSCPGSSAFQEDDNSISIENLDELTSRIAEFAGSSGVKSSWNAFLAGVPLEDLLS